MNNAGIAGVPGPDDWLTVADYQKCLDVNTFGMIRVCHAFKPLVKKMRGRIVNMTSIIARIAAQLAGPYAVSKYAAEAYCDVLRYRKHLYLQYN